ncbi:MAG: metal ABC transporter ATP-binding protein [Candidatus Cloacimonetes bacterium]|nr:metal ABC transporter ATP-binding protein [Candidatus Cloacimonadota bacterium]
MAEETCALEIHDLTVAYGTKPVLWDIDLCIPKGKLVAIIGPNGAGKTTLIKSMVGLIKPVSGGVHFQIIEVKKGKFRNKIAYVPQSGSVDWDFPATVLDVVMMGRYGHLGWFKTPGRNEKNMALETLDKVGMREYANRQISQLSGGQQQRVFLARALIQDAEIYFMDEPFKGVDAQTEKSIVELLKNLKTEGKTVIVVHHDLQTVTSYFDWAILINLRIIANGSVEEVFNEQNLNLTYGNREHLKQEAN